MRLIRAPQTSVLIGSRPERRVLALCGDTQVGLWLVRSLGRAGLHCFCVCASPNALAAHSRYCAGAWMPTAGGGADRAVAELESLARELRVGSIMPIAENLHVMLIKQRARFEPDIHVFSPPAECFQKATDKQFMTGLCHELGIPAARGATLDRFMAGAEAADWRFPLVLRTRNQNLPDGARAPWKAAYAATEAQLQSLYASVQAIADNIIVQEYHPGVEDHIQVLMHHGEPFTLCEYIGEHHMPLAGGVTVQRITCRHDNLRRDAVRLLQAIAWEGVAAVQFHIEPRTGDYIFLEINPRFCGGLPTVILAGFDAPFLLWQSHFEPGRMKATPCRLGLRTRILGGDVNWMIGMMRGDELPPGQKRLGKLSSLCRFLYNCGPWTRDDVFLWRDLKPFWVDGRNMLRKLGGKSFDLIGGAEPAP